MRKAFLLLIVCSSFLGLRAQEDYNDEVIHEETETSASPIQARLDKAIARLQLTDEQIPQMETLLLEFVQRMQEEPPASSQEKSKRRRELRTAVSKILTPQQLELLRQRKGRKGSANQPEKANSISPPGQQTNSSWLNRLIDEVASPLLQKHLNNDPDNGGG